MENEIREAKSFPGMIVGSKRLALGSRLFKTAEDEQETRPPFGDSGITPLPHVLGAFRVLSPAVVAAR